MKRVGVDLDGVCYDFAASVREFLMRSCARFEHQCPDPQRWEFYEDWGLTLDEFLTWCHRGVDAGVIFSHGGLLPNVAETFSRIKSAGHSIHIVTDRSFGREGASERATRAWLDRHGLTFDSLTFTADKTVVKLDAMIDDKLGNYDALSAAGVDVWLLNRPWNAQDDDRRRCDSLLEYVEAVA